MAIYLAQSSTSNDVAADLIDDTRRHLNSGESDSVNLLTQAIDNAQTNITFTRDVTKMTEGTQISVGLETLYVWSIDAGSKTATVLRGYQGDAVAHTTDELALVAPRFTTWDIWRELNRDIVDLSSPGSGLFQIKFVDIVIQSAVYGYDLAADVLDVLEVRQQAATTTYKNWPKVESYALLRGFPVSDFPSGTGIRFDEGLIPQKTVRVIYKAAFAPYGNFTDNAQAGGLTASMLDIPPLGAASRLLAGRETRRNALDTQGSARRAGEVGAGAIRGASQWLKMLHDDRVKDEAIRLRTDYPLLRVRPGFNSVRQW